MSLESLLQTIDQFDIATRFQQAVQFIKEADPYFIAVVVAVFVFLGTRIVSGQSGLQSLGLRLAAATFLIFGGYTVYEKGGFENVEMGDLALRSANAGGAVLAVTWIILPILTFIYTHLRVALAAFIGYSGYAIATSESVSAEDLPRIAIVGGIVAGLALIVAWILHPIWDYVKALLPQPKKRPVVKEQEEEPEAEDQDAEPAGRRRRGRGRRRRLTIIDTRTTGFDENNKEQVTTSKIQIDTQRRRDQARLKIEMTYAMALPEIGGRLTRTMFNDFISRYLGDHLPPEEVEGNAQQLQLMLNHYQTPGQGPQDFTNMEQLAQWYDTEMKRIENSNDSPTSKESLLAELRQQYMTHANRIMQLRPTIIDSTATVQQG